jgi:predicted RecB family nuclease
LSAPIGLLEGIGEKTAKVFANEGITTIGQLLNYQGNNEQIKRFCAKAMALGY